VGRHLARELAARGHEIVLIARGFDRRDPSAVVLLTLLFFLLSATDLSFFVWRE
jgi:nucleoside-diphosphate-sugar epimerase